MDLVCRRRTIYSLINWKCAVVTKYKLVAVKYLHGLISVLDKLPLLPLLSYIVRNLSKDYAFLQG